MDHEYLRNVLLQANGSFYHDDYRGGGSQSLYAFGTGVTYLLNRNASATLGYDFLARESGNGTGTNLGTAGAAANVSAWAALNGGPFDPGIGPGLRLRLHGPPRPVPAAVPSLTKRVC